MDSGSSMTLSPSSHAVFDTMYDVYSGSVVARMNTALYFGISEMSSRKRKWNSCPASSAACLKFWRADSSLWSEKCISLRNRRFYPLSVSPCFERSVASLEMVPNSPVESSSFPIGCKPERYACSLTFWMCSVQIGILKRL